MGGDRAQLGREGAAVPVQHQESVHRQCDTRNRPPAEEEVRMVSTVRLLLLDLFNTELSPERYWHGLRSGGGGGGGGGVLHAMLLCHHRKDSALRWAAVRMVVMFR